MEQQPEPNVFDVAFKEDAFPVYARLRAEGPVTRTTLPDGRTGWLVVGYEEGQAVLKDYQRFGNDVRNALTEEQQRELFRGVNAGLTEDERAQAMRVNELFAHHVLAVDPPDHSRLRRLVAQSFTPRFVQGLRPRVQQLADQLLDGMEGEARRTGRREADLIDAFAFPLPITVISDMLGVPHADRDRFREWSNTFVRVGPAGGGDREAIADMLEFGQYIRVMCAEKRRHPADDLVTGLVLAESEGDVLTEDEVVSMVFLLIIAGHETTVNLIGNGMLALCEHPDQIARLKQDPALIKPAIEEMLRYYGPVETSLRRFAREDTVLAGHQIKRGEQVNVSIASADRDPALMADPERFDVTREPGRHLAFGTGIHACLGAPLARLEGQVAFASLLDRFPEIRLAVPRAELTWRDSGILRGLTRLPVAF